MKVVGAAIWFLWCMIIMTVIIMPSIAIEEDEEVGKKLGFTTVTFTLTKEGYEQFLNTLRNTVAASTRACNIAYTQKNPATDAQYVLVKLQLQSKWITLGIDASSFYVWAYQDTYAGKTRATFLNDAPTTAKNALFQGSTQRTTPFGGNYISLEPAAHTTRQTIPLTFEGLQGDIEAIFGSAAVPGQPEAKFFLRAIQMVAEAARFRFIQKAIRDGKTNEGNFRQKLVAYETSWDKISQAIHRAEATSPNKCQVISHTLVISDIGFRQEVNNVNEIKDDLGLLKYKESSLINIRNAPLVDDEDHVGLGFLESALM